MARISILLTFIASLAGCEGVGGLKREAHFAGALDLACIETAVRSVEGVSEVKVSLPDSLTYRIAGTKGDAVHGPSSGRIYVVQHRKGPRLYDTFLAMNRSPPLDDMEVARPTMVKVEKAIGTQCPYSPDPASYREICKAPRCTAGT